MTEINADKRTNKKRKNILLILDDGVCDHNIHQSPSLKQIVRGRHINIAIILSF